MTQPAAENPLNQRLEGPAPVLDVAKDLVRRSVFIAPVAIVLGSVFWLSLIHISEPTRPY